MGKKGKKTKKQPKNETSEEEEEDIEEEELEEERTVSKKSSSSKNKKKNNASSKKKKKGAKRDETDEDDLEEKSDDDSDNERKEDSEDDDEEEEQNSADDDDEEEEENADDNNVNKLYTRKLKKDTKNVAKMIFEQVRNNKKISSLYQCFDKYLSSKKVLDAPKFKKKLEGLIGKNKSEYKNIDVIHQEFSFGGKTVTFVSFFNTMYQYIHKDAGPDLKNTDLEMKTLKEKYIGKDISEGKTINNVIKEKKINKKFLVGNLEKKSFKTDIVKQVLPSLSKKDAKDDFQLIFDIFSCVCKEKEKISMSDFLKYIGDFKASVEISEEETEEETEEEEDEEQEQEDDKKKKKDKKKDKKKSASKFSLVSKDLKSMFETFVESSKDPIATIRKEFQKVDKKKKGTIAFKDFEKIIKKKISKNATSKDLLVVMDCFDYDGEKVVSYAGFVEYLETLSESDEVRNLKNKLRSNIISNLDNLPDDDEALTYKKRRELLSGTFSKLDKKNQGYVSTKNFEKKLKSLIDVSKDDLKILSKALDKDKNGKISYAEFVAFVFPDRAINKTIRALRSSLKAAIKHLGGENAVKKIFDDIDADKNGKISSEECLVAFIDCAFPLDASIVYQVMLRYDKNGDGSIDPEEFFDILEGEDDDESESDHDEEDKNLDESTESNKNDAGVLLTKSIKKILWEGGIALAIKEKTSAKDAVLKGFKKKMNEDSMTISVDRDKFLKDLQGMKIFELKAHHYEKIADSFSLNEKRSSVDLTEFAAFVATPAHDFGRDGKYIKKVAEKLHAGIDKEFEKRKDKYKTTYTMMKELFAKHGNGNKKKGTIPGSKLNGVLKVISPSVKLETDELDALQRRFLIKGNIHYNDFIYFIDPQPDTEKLLKKLRVKIKIMERHGTDIEKIFDEADQDDSNALSYSEFSALLKNTCGLPLTDAQCYALIKRLDVDGDEEIDMDEFLDLVLEEEEEEEEEEETVSDGKKKEKKSHDTIKKDANTTKKNTSEDWDKIKKILIDWIEDNEENIETFEEEAENVAGEKSTSIDDDEFVDCLLTAGCDKLSQAQQNSVCNKFRTKGKANMVDFVDFIDYCDKEHGDFMDAKEKEAKKQKGKEKEKSSSPKDKKPDKNNKTEKEDPSDKEDDSKKTGTKKSSDNKNDGKKKKIKETTGTKVLKHSKNQKFKIGDVLWVGPFDDDDIYEQVKIISYNVEKKEYKAKFMDGDDEDVFDEDELFLKNPKDKSSNGKDGTDVKGKKKDTDKTPKKSKEKETKKKKVTIKEEEDSSEEEEEEDDDDDEENLSVDEWYKKVQEKAFDQAFKEIDTDGSGTIDAKELGSALRAMGQTPTDEEVQSLLSEFDHSNTGQIDKNGFRRLMKRRLGHKRHKELREKSKITLDQVRVLFEEIDVDHSGSLDSTEFEILVKKRMRILLTSKEFASLFEAIDLDNSGTVEFEEFSALWDAVQDQQNGVGGGSKRAMSALAERAVQKIAKGPIEDPRKYLRAFAGMPSNFRPSVLSKLDNEPQHSIAHMLSGATDELMSHQVLKAHDSGKKIKFGDLRKQTNKSSIALFIKLDDATGVPIPDEENRKHVENRWIRVCMMRGDPNEDQDSGASRRQFVGNQHIALANLKEEDVWDFTKQRTGLSNKRMIIRSNASDAKDLYLVFELTCTVRKSGQSGAKSTYEMGVAWGAIKLEDAIVQSKKIFKLTMKGGTIDEDTDIKPEEILQRRTGLKSLFHRKKTACQLQLTFFPISTNSNKMNADDRASIRLLPPTVITSIECVKLLHMYRYIMSNGYSDALTSDSSRGKKKNKKKKKKKKKKGRNYDNDEEDSSDSDNNDSDEENDSDSDDGRDGRRGRRGKNSSLRKDMSTPTFGIHLPELKIFPEILKEPALLVQLLNFPEIKNIQKTMKNDSLLAAKQFRACVLRIWPQLTVHGAAYSHEHGGVDKAERRRLRPTKTAKNMLGTVQRANLDQPFMSNLEHDGGAGWNKPFHIDEVTVLAPDTACAFSSMQNMILASVTGKAKTARKVKRGGESPNRRRPKTKNRWDDDDDF